MDKLGIYIHIPFCKKKCKYCDFISFSSSCENIDRYFKAIINEINDKEISNLENREISTIYIGGGTPSFVDSKYIINVMNALKNKFKIKDNAEITIEINPGTIDSKKLIDYKNIGINRVSIGLQTTNDRLLNLIGRIHNYNDFLNTYKLVKDIGFENINVDLMLALPTQTKEELIESLNKVIKENPTHISVYSLILEENTELEKLILDGTYDLVDEETERRMYWIAKEILEKNGYKHYEISNFSKVNSESKHNLDCWNQNEYIGYGLAAHSYLKNKRFSNTIDFGEYIKNIENGCYNQNIEVHEIQDGQMQKKEFMMLGLRKIEGVSISEFEKKFRINPLFYFRFEISKLTDEELIEVDLDNIKLTKKGLDFANKVFEEFV